VTSTAVKSVPLGRAAPSSDQMIGASEAAVHLPEDTTSKEGARRTVPPDVAAGRSVDETNTPAEGSFAGWTAVTIPTGMAIGEDSSPVSCAPGTTHCVAVLTSTSLLQPGSARSVEEVAVTSDLVDWEGYNSLPSAFAQVGSLECPTVSVCVAVGESSAGGPVIAYSTDGGVDWAEADMSPFADVAGWAWSVTCASAAVCYTVGGTEGSGNPSSSTPMAAVSDDGGQTWTLLGSGLPSPQGYYLDSISCTSTSNCVAGGSVGEIGPAIALWTTDGGTVWYQSSSSALGTLNDLFSLSCPEGGSVCFAGSMAISTGGPELAQTADLGASWSVISVPDGGDGWASSVSCADALTCWVAGAGTTLSLAGTGNGGASFQESFGSTSNQDASVACSTTEICAATTVDGLWVTSINGDVAPDGNASTVQGSATFAGTGVAGVCVYLESPTNALDDLYSTTTNGNGAYTLSEVVPGNYVVQFDPSCYGSVAGSSMAGQFYNGAVGGSATLAGATSVPLSNSSIDISASLAQGAGLTGDVTFAGEPVIGACAYMFNNTDGWSYNTTTGTDGNYQISGITLDSYYILYDPTCGGTNNSTLAPQYSNGASDGDHATMYDFTSADIGTDATINIALVAGATISGTVSSQGPSALALANVCAYLTSPDDAPYSYSELTGSNGTYSFYALPATEWTMILDPTCEGAQASDFLAQDYGTAIWTLSGSEIDVGTVSLPFSTTMPTITPSVLAGGTVGSQYSQDMVATGGTAPYTWSAEGLPPGLGINSSTGTITGVPTSAGDFSPQLTATDSSAQAFPITMVGSLDVSTVTIGLPGGSLGGGSPGGGAPVVTTTTTVPVTTTTVSTSTTNLPPLPPGLPPGSFGARVTGTVTSDGAQLSDQGNGASAHLLVPPGALPAGTTLSIVAVNDSAALAAKVPVGQSYLASFALSWLTPAGISPAATAPIVVTIDDPSIRAGDIVYFLTPSGRLQVAGVATANGTATVRVTTDPDFVVANVPELGAVAVRATFGSGVLRVVLSCTAVVRCTGTASVSAKVQEGTSERRAVVAEGSFVLPAGRTARVSLPVTSAGRTALVDNPRGLGATLTISLLGGKKATYHIELP